MQRNQAEMAPDRDNCPYGTSTVISNELDLGEVRDILLISRESFSLEARGSALISCMILARWCLANSMHPLATQKNLLAVTLCRTTMTAHLRATHSARTGYVGAGCYS